MFLRLSVLLLFCVPAIYASKLNVPRVLLPIFNDFQTRFVLEDTEGGCYKWTTTRSDIIQLNLIDENTELGCSTKVVVATVTKEAARNIAVVFGEDVHTKENLRCYVIVDVIHSLIITTTTRELFMEEAPEDFEVKAYDDQGNEFSSLENVEFEWNIIPLGPKKDTVIRYITYKDSPYEVPAGIQALEEQNKRGHSILLEGVKSGSAKVTVKLPYDEYKHVQPCEVQLMIVANLLISPAEVYVMPGDVVPFKIFFINSGRIDEINMPDNQYYLEAEDSTIAQSFKKNGDIKALQQGKTKILLRDRNIDKDSPLLKLPSATFHVVNPEYIVLNVMPHKNWAILVGQHHDIVADLYDVTDHKIFVGESVRIDLSVTPEFYVSSQTLNGSWMTGYGIKSGVATVHAVMKTSGDGQTVLDQPIQAKVDLMIYPNIVLEPGEVILPWDPVTRPKYDVDLVAKGGDGRFLWASSDNSIGVVSQSGHVRTHSSGFFEVSAVMMRNHHNRKSTKFMILPPSRLEIVEFVMETEVGSPVYIHLALYAETVNSDNTVTVVPFTRCQDLPFQIKQSDVKFKQNKTASIPPVGISCGNLAMVALNVGISKITITYFQDGHALEDSVTVSAFKPLQLLQPKKDIVLAVGSSINLVYTGGPRAQIGKNAEHQKVVVSEDETIAAGLDATSLHEIPGEDFTVVRVLCKKLGETDIKLMISNNPTTQNCQGQTSTVITRITCGKPRKITLKPELQIADTSNCPMDLSSGNVVVQSTSLIEIDVSVWDDCGNRFLNFSSLNLEWKIAPFSSGVLVSKDGVFPKNITIGNVAVAHKSYQSFMPHIDIGPLEINVTVTGYNKQILNKLSIKPEWPEFIGVEDKNMDLQPITANLKLYLVEDTTLSETAITLFNHPGNRKMVQVQQGSGFFEIAVSDEAVVDVIYQERTKQLEIVPLKSGDVVVQLLDLCLMSKPASLRVTVTSIGIIRLDMPDKVEISKCVSCIVRIYDENDNLMDIPDLKMVDLRPEFTNKITNIQRSEEKTPLGEIHYIITGVELGNTKLTFSAASNDEDIVSGPMDLQVFQPLQLHPRNGSVLIGAEIQLIIKGGPQSDIEVYFEAQDKRIAMVSDKGILKGVSIGKSRVFAKAIGVHPSTGESIVYSQDSVEVTVVALTGVKIGAPLTRFKVGTTVPFWCFGLPDISPVVLGTVVDPPIFFRWLVNDKLLADLTGVYHPLGINIGRPDRIVLKLTGLQAGTTRVYVNVTVPGAVANKLNIHQIMFSSFVDIEIIEPLAVTRPRQPFGGPLLMAPFSQLQLATNMDAIHKVEYALPGEQIASTELLAEKSVIDTSPYIVTLTPEGVLQSYGKLGQTMLVITSVDSETGLKQHLNIIVEVKPVHYMSLIIQAHWRISFNHPVPIVPLGSNFFLVASYHDNMGNQFHAGPTDLKVRTSRCDLVKVVSFPENGSLWISTKKAGHTMMKVWADGVQKTTDYIKFNVQQSVKPALDHLTAGDTVCLWSPIVTTSNQPGIWSSSDSGLVEINPALDIAFVGARSGTVSLKNSLLPAASIYVDILPVQAIEFLIPANFIMTNGEDQTLTRFVLVLQSEKSFGIKTNNLIQGWRCRSDVRKLVHPEGFNCFMKFSNELLKIKADSLFNISNSWVPETGQYACKVMSEIIITPETAVLDTDFIIWAKTDDGKVTSEEIAIKFLPGVYVERELLLDELTNIAELKIIALDEVLQQIKVNPADSSILYVNQIKTTEPNLAKYEVQLLDYHWRLADMNDAMGIDIVSPVTKQKIRVIVKVTGDFKDGGRCGIYRSPIMRFLSAYKYALVMMAAMLVIFLLTFYVYSTYMQPVVNVNVQPRQTCAANRSLQQTRFSPSTSSPPVPPSSPCKFNCSCAKHRSPNSSAYGEYSSYYNSPELRRNRRCM